MILPVVELVEARRSAAGIRDRDLKSLGGQKLREPASHLAAAADDQCALARPMTLRRNTRRLLCGERGLDELPQQRLGQVGLEAEPLSLVRPRRITSRSRAKSRVARPVARFTSATCSLNA